MTIYTTLLVIYALGYLSSRNDKNAKKTAQLCFFLLFPLLFLTAFRAASVGNDTSVYIYGYNAIAQASSLISLIRYSRYEAGYVVLVYIFSHLKLSYHVFQVVVSAFIFYSVYRFFKRYSKNVWLSVYVFFTLRYAISTMNVVRMYLAIAIVLYAIPFLQKRRLYPFVALTILASLFHATALIFLVMYPLSTLQIKRRTIIWILSLALVVLALGKPFFAWLTKLINRYQGYLSSKYFNFDNNIAVYLSLAIDISLFVFLYLTQKGSLETGRSYRQKGKQEEGVEPIPIEHIELWAALMVMTIGVVGLGNTIMTRVSGYFSIFFTTGIPSAVYALRRRTNRRIMKLALVFFLALQFYAVMILRPQWNGVTPYRAFFRF